MTIRRLLVLAALSLALPAAAQPFPARSLTMIVPFAAGTPVDIWVRPVAERLAQALKQPVVVDNRPGNNTWIGTIQASKAPPDGYTMVVIGGGTLNEVFFKDPALDPFKAFSPVSLLFRGQHVLYSSGTIAATDLRQFIAWAKANPGTATYGHASANVRMVAEQIRLATGFQATAVPYKTVAQISVGMTNGELQFAVDIPTTYAALADAGKVRALATISDRRHPLLPNVPTTVELGVNVASPGFQQGIWVPAGTPREAIAVLNAAAVETLRQPEIQAHIRKFGNEAVSSTPEAFLKSVQDEAAFWRKAAKDIGYQPE